MKNLIRFFGIFLLIFGLTACDEIKDKIDELTEFDINTTVTGTILVEVEPGENVVLDDSTLFNIADGGQDIVDNLNKIENVDITSLTYKVISFEGDVAGVITADLIADGDVLDSYTDTVVSNELFVTQTISDTAALNAIADQLQAGNDVEFAITGTSTCESAMEFNIEITIGIEVTVDAG